MADRRDAAKPELSKRLLAAGKAYGQWRLAGQLMARRVEVLHGQSDGTLCLQFSNGDMLIIKGGNGPYEAYHIQYARSQITV